MVKVATRLQMRGECIGETFLGATAGRRKWYGWSGCARGARVTFSLWPLLTLHSHLIPAVSVTTQPTVLTAIASLGDAPERASAHEAVAAVTEGGLAEGDLLEGVQESQAQLGADGAGMEQILGQLLSAEGATPVAGRWVKPMAGKGEVA